MPETLLELFQRLLGENQERPDGLDRQHKVPSLWPKPVGAHLERRQGQLQLGAAGREKILIVNDLHIVGIISYIMADFISSNGGAPKTWCTNFKTNQRFREYRIRGVINDVEIGDYSNTIQITVS